MSNATLQVGGGNWAAQDGKLLGYAVEPTSGRYLAREFTVNRDSSKWVLGSDGYLYEVPADQPALEYYSDGTFRGALVEPESTNEALNSESINSWDKQSGANVENNVETAPNNTQTADRVYGVSGDTYVFIRQTFTFSGVTSGDFVATFSTTTGQIATNDSEITNTKAISLANGWYRISATLENKYTTSLFVKKDREGSIGIRYQTNQNRIVIQFSGSPEPSVYVWGIQLEESPIATSYIPTTTDAVTRLKDDIFFTNASSFIGQSEGTLFIEVDWQDSGDNAQIFSISDDSADNRIVILNNNNVSPAELRMLILSSTSTEVNQGEVSSAYTGIQKIALAYKQNDCELYRNGSSVSTYTTADLSSLATLTDVDFGQSFNAGAQANMWIRDARIYNTRLSATECLTLTGADLSDPYAPINGNEFEWNGFTYKVIVKNGLAWLDRNLGATRAATSSTDSQAYGDLYQWGRLTDGHEKRNSGTTSTLSTTDVPGNDDFITFNNFPYDWRNPQNDNLWQGVTGINNPAPPGWRIPTEAEWNTERQSWSSNDSTGAYASLLKLPVAGNREGGDGSLIAVGSYGAYWSSGVDGTLARRLFFNSTNSYTSGSRDRTDGYSVRCVRDIP